MSVKADVKAKEWGCSTSTVKRYCSSGIIPTAEQVGARKTWYLTDECEKPPMTRHGLCFLLDTVYQLNHGVLFKDIKWGYCEKDVKAGYDYLISCAFMSSINTSKLDEELHKATATPRGEALIERENSENRSDIKYKAYVKANSNIGLASVEIGAEVSNG